MNEINDLVVRLAARLHTRQLKITTAESCTGGLIAGLLTDLPGSSAWFERGFVTYSLLAKQEMLGIPAEFIRLHSVYSEAVAKAMALGALEHSAAQVALAVTGVAGPGGGSIDYPVGSVYFGWAMRNETAQSACYHFKKASRQMVRQLACKQALEGVLSLLK